MSSPTTADVAAAKKSKAAAASKSKVSAVPAAAPARSFRRGDGRTATIIGRGSGSATAFIGHGNVAAPAPNTASPSNGVTTAASGLPQSMADDFDSSPIHGRRGYPGAPNSSNGTAAADFSMGGFGAVGSSHGRGMLGSIDCMHWAWKNCPKGWAGMFTRGDKGVPTMILEAVASRDLRIWHAFFGTAGAHNDINVLNKSPLFIQAIKGEAPRVEYNVNGTQYDMGYYLADKIYPEWAVFMKTVTAPQTEKDKLFALKQEGARKNVECAFGMLQSRFDIVRRPARLWKQGDVINIMQACVILHNMIVEDEKELVKIPLDMNENASATIVLPPEVCTSNNPNPCFAEVLRRNSAIRARPTHRQLKKDLVEHIWQRYGHNGN